MRIIISSAYVALQRNHPNSGWSERLAIRQQHVGDVPRCVLDRRLSHYFGRHSRASFSASAI